MTKDEVVQVLLDKHIIMLIGEEYHLTEKYLEVLDSPIKIEPITKVTGLDYAMLLDPTTNGNHWPVEINETRDRIRYTNMMDLCEVPTYAAKGYRLRSSSKEAFNIISNIVDNQGIQPAKFMQAVKLYYRYTEMPKGFRNLVTSGDILDIYQEHLAGKLESVLISNSGEGSNTNQTWQ